MVSIASSTEYLRSRHGKRRRAALSRAWIIDAATWDRFCATCVKLKTFNWTVVPFSTEFFHIFAKHRKPELRELGIAAPGNWNWARYFTENKADASKGYGRTAKDVSVILKACPILRRLSIHISDQDLGSRSNMDQELFGDDFIEALVRFCPVLQMLQITNYNNDAQRDHTIMTFTDRSLRALATLQYLTMLEIKSVNITGNGVYDLVSTSPEGFLGQREFGHVIGDTAGPTEKAFYDVVMGFVTKLAEQSGPLPWANRRIALQLVNKRTGKQKGVGRSWSKMYCRDLRKLVKTVLKRHPTFRMRVVLMSWKDESFGDMFNFTFFTETTKLPPPMDLTPHEHPIDDVFYHHVFDFSSMFVNFLPQH